VPGGARLGTLVSPTSFRHRSKPAKGRGHGGPGSDRVKLGMGTGWSGREHAGLRFPCPPLDDRIWLLEQQLQVVNAQAAEGLLSSTGATTRGATSTPAEARSCHRARR
jgi:hypothetical protein